MDWENSSFTIILLFEKERGGSYKPFESLTVLWPTRLAVGIRSKHFEISEPCLKFNNIVGFA